MALFVFWAVLATVIGFAWWISRIPSPARNRKVAASCPVELHYAMSVLADPTWSARVWQRLGFASPDVGVPTVLEIESSPVGARLEVQIPTGQSPADWMKKADTIAAGFAVSKVRVLDLGRGVVAVDLVVFDPLADGDTVPQPLETVDLEAVDTGTTEDGQLWLVPVLGRHLLFAGVSGAGKSSAVWALLAGMAPAIKSGLVELWGIDPKRVEVSPGRELFTRFAVGMDENVLVLLRELVAVMDDRLDTMAAAKSRKHVPTVDEPLIVMWIDEVLALTAFAPDKEIRTDVDRLIRLLMSQGRAAGISLIVCSQDPSKEIMAWRQMVTLRIGLRMDEATQTAMVLGQGARDRGARCDEIAPSTPGVAYVGEDGRAEFVRVRAYHVTDADIAYLVAHYAPEIDWNTNYDNDTDGNDDFGKGRHAA